VLIKVNHSLTVQVNVLKVTICQDTHTDGQKHSWTDRQTDRQTERERESKAR